MGPVDGETQQPTESRPNRRTSHPNNNQSHMTQMMKTTMTTAMTADSSNDGREGGEGGSNDATIKQTTTTRTMTKPDNGDDSNGRAETWTRREVGRARRSKHSSDMSHHAHCACPPKTTQQSNKQTMIMATTTMTTTTMTRQGQSRPRRCWTADAVGLICFLFGSKFVGAEDDDAVVVIVVGGSDSLFSEVKSDSDAESSSMPTKTTSRRFLFASPFCARQRRTCWGTILLALSGFENPARIMAPVTLTPVVVWRIRTAESTFF
jgi:hypothetical protein